MLNFDCYSDDKTNLFKREVDITFTLYYPAAAAIYSKQVYIRVRPTTDRKKYVCVDIS
jgi:hypothetical protein